MQNHQSYISEIYHKILQNENLSLSDLAVGDYSVLTTTVNGNRSRHTSGIFLPKFCLSSSYQVFLDTFLKAWLSQPHLSKAEFVEWLICGNKASNRTNNASRLTAVVETISHPLQGGNHLLITVKRLFTMKPNPNFADFPQNLTRCNRCNVATFPVKAGNSSQSEWENIVQNIREKSYKSYEPEQKTILPTLAVISYPFGVVAKSTTSRRKLNNLLMANDSTPLHRAFFVRRLRTPKINLAIDLFSMVGRKGQRLGVGCVPLVAVFLPLYALPPTVGKLAVDVKNLLMELSKMLFKFLVLGDKRLTISIRAKSEAEARQKLQFTSPALCVARLKGGVYA